MEITTDERKIQIKEKRKEKLLSKLTQRNEERKTINNESESKLEEMEIDELMKNVKIELEEKQLDSAKIEQLQNYLTFSLANHRTKAIQSLLEDIRKFKISQKPAPKFKGFSFSKSKTSSSAPKIEQIEQKTDEIMEVVGFSAQNIVEDLKNEEKVINGQNGTDVSLKNIENCKLEFHFEPSVIHIKNIRNSTLIFLRCNQSILMHDCENIHLFVAAQQVRIHTSNNVHLHVATRGAVILEETKNVFVQPYQVRRKNGELVEVEDNGEWKTPKDFDWLATSQSPNWSLVDEEKWTIEQLSF